MLIQIIFYAESFPCETCFKFEQITSKCKHRLGVTVTILSKVLACVRLCVDVWIQESAIKLVQVDP